MQLTALALCPTVKRCVPRLSPPTCSPEQEPGALSAAGTAIDGMYGFGAWINSAYACDFDTRTNTAVNAKAWAGRLPE